MVDSGFSELTNDFINFELGTKGGYKYVDVDGDLATTDDQDVCSTAGTSTSTPTTVSSPARGTEKTLSSTPSPPVMASGPTATTSSTAWPPARTSSVRSARPAGSQLDPAPDSATEADCGTGVYKITVDSGFSELTNDFINFELGTKGGYKYVDVDGDLATTDDQAHPLNGWDINLYADDGLVPGTWDGSNTVLDTVTTGDGLWADGYYEFDGLAAGTYFVGEVCETGWIQLDPAPDSATEADCGTGVYKITVDSGFSELTNDFINFELGTKGGYKYVDVDGDLATTDDQDPLNGWDINLYADDGLVPGTWDGSNTVLDTVTTGDGLWADGYYEFDGLAAGTYFVGEVCETGCIHLHCGAGQRHRGRLRHRGLQDHGRQRLQ